MKGIINYICIIWMGPRRGSSYAPGYLLKRQIDALTTQRHHLAQITFVLQNCPQLDEVPDELFQLDRIRETPVVFFRHANSWSYPAFMDAYREFRDRFSYYIFAEDDYLPVRDDFDLILRSLIDGEPNCGYLCQYRMDAEESSYGEIAAISNGICREDALAAVDALTNIDSLGVQRDDEGQVMFSQGFLQAGFRIADWRSHYRAPFRSGGGIEEYAPEREGYLIAPVELLETLNA